MALLALSEGEHITFVMTFIQSLLISPFLEMHFLTFSVRKHKFLSLISDDHNLNLFPSHSYSGPLSYHLRLQTIWMNPVEFHCT